MRICNRCGSCYDESPAISRKDNLTEICPMCGMIEALEAATNYLPKVYTVYSSEADITFVLEDTDTTTSVVGFYYGEPDENATKKYYGRLVAEYR